MISNLEKILQTPDQQEEVQRLKAQNTASNSGGADEGQYTLLKSALPAGYDAYENLLKPYMSSSMEAINAGHNATMTALNAERGEIEEQAEQNQTAARSAVWNTQRLAGDGLLTRGLSNTGLADVITAIALNQASANAYQALLDRQSALRENDTAKAEAFATTKNAEAETQKEFGGMLGDAYLNLYDNETDRELKMLLQNMDADSQYALQVLKNQGAIDLSKLDADSQFALQALKNQGAIDLSKLDADSQYALQVLKNQGAIDLSKLDADSQFALQALKNQGSIDLSKLDADSQYALQALKNQGAIDQSAQDYNYKLALEELKRKWALEDREAGL